MSEPVHDLSRAGAVLAVALLLTACAVGPDYHAPEPEVDAAFAGQTLVETTAQEPLATWWQGFGDPLLDQLVADALAGNHTIAIAAARLKEARAARRESVWSSIPAPTARASATDIRESQGGTAGFSPERDYELYDAAFDASWELDLFGRVRRGNQAARATLGAAHASLDDVRLSVVAEIVRNYFELRGAQQRLTVAERNAGNQRSALELVESRLEAGRGTALDTARAEAQIQTTLASVPPLEAAVVQARHRIEVLSGRRPGQLTEQLGPLAPLPALPALLGMDDPVSLLRRRPDLRVAERQLAATSARIGVAMADFFPRITLNGSIGLQALEFGALDDPGNDFRRFGPALSWSFLDFGRVRERVRAAGARHEAALASYEQAVLLALEDVENALSTYARERRRQEHLAAAARASVLAAELATQRFEGGVSDFLTALDAYRTALEAEDRLSISQTAAATALVALYKALGVSVPEAMP
ncbi:MAG TPA: efflux transporter outer membrane subunit [Steroidobacteraceae bacterium]|nr:efflux transporter outer membrane subunit [Steroidobacteraceae bacterium]